MKRYFKHVLSIGILFLIFDLTADAQILQTRTEVIETYGSPYHSGVTDDGENYLFYKTAVKTKNSGTYFQRRVLFFRKSDDGTETCYKWKILEPSSETIANISSFTRNLVQVGENQWKDYGKAIVYKVEEKNGVCSITAWYDREVELARVYKM